MVQVQVTISFLMSVLKHFEGKEILFMKEKEAIFDGGHRKLSLHVNSIDVS